MPPSSKKTQLCSNQNRNDKISDLPDSILSMILSHLPTVEAVRTCVLSKTWRTIWTNVTELRFDDMRHSEPKDHGFIEFVDHVIRDIESPKINSFHLHSVNAYDETPLVSWLSNLINQRSLQKLVITWYELESDILSPLFASFGSLVELRLRTKCILDISAPALLPTLKFFSLEDARIFNMSSVSENIFLYFPVLETFEVSRCCWFRTDTVVIDSPLLRVFEFLKCSSEHVPSDDGVCTISIFSSKLEKITFSGDGNENMFLTFPTSLPDAYLDLSGAKWPYLSHWPKFLHAFTCVKSLGLELTRDFQLTTMPKFKQLVYLHLAYDMTQPYIFRRVLKSAPILKILSIRDTTSPRIKPSKMRLNELRSQTAPDCVRTMLKVLQFRDFRMHEPKLSVLRHVIANAEILESVVLSTARPITKKGKELVLSYPKASPHASVLFQ
ncbi:hypothetical protein EUTSA_v10022020mg [Eutrema salsugineum]|uniref:F-box domain-containing protein n=2 Tax=Eutrema salsugineum TaxID=72664 RepID=V4NPR0_EUTSA|nr:hypothetical protein EUTSA_v10022020mg [Eutrema salsugineum]